MIIVSGQGSGQCQQMLNLFTQTLNNFVYCSNIMCATVSSMALTSVLTAIPGKLI